MSPYAIIFDLDGTLVDSLEEIVECMNLVLEEQGLPLHSREVYRYFVGDGVRKLVRRALPTAERARFRATLRRFQEVYEPERAMRSKPYPGVDELMHRLVERRIQLSILSNRPHRMTTRVVRQWFDAVPFVKVQGARHGVPRKPDPQVALAQAEAMGVDPRHVLLVGDTVSDMQTAAAAGMGAVGVAWGFREAKELDAGGAKVVLRCPLDLLEHLPN